jgi:hypothetical protein
MSTDTFSTEQDRNYMLYHRDGLMDIFIGFVILGFGLSILTEMTYMAGISVVILLPLWYSLRRSLVYPRVGEIEVTSSMRLRMTLVVFFLSGLLLFGVVLGLFMYTKSDLVPTGLITWLRANFDLFFGAFMAGVISFTAVLLKTHRLHLYSIITIATFVTVNLLGLHLWVGMVTVGGLVLLGGVIVLISFLLTYSTE